jgi:hypothetical protein
MSFQMPLPIHYHILHSRRLDRFLLIWSGCRAHAKWAPHRISSQWAHSMKPRSFDLLRGMHCTSNGYWQVTFISTTPGLFHSYKSFFVAFERYMYPT